MSTEQALTPQQRFEEKLTDKLREDIGALLPDDVLANLVEKSMHEMFFKRGSEKEHSGWNAKTIETPSWFERQVKELLEPRINAEIEALFDEQRAAITQMAVKAITDAAPGMLAAALFGYVQTKTQDVERNVQVHVANAFYDLFMQNSGLQSQNGRGGMVGEP